MGVHLVLVALSLPRSRPQAWFSSTPPSTSLLGRWKIGRLNGRYLCGEECIALNILNGMTRQRNGFTYAEARGGPTEAVTIAGIREAVEVGRDYLGLEMPRRNLDGFDHLLLKDPIEEHRCQSR